MTVLAPAEYTLTVAVTERGTPIDQAIVRLGHYRATTDAAGVATIRLTRGNHELVVWKAGYDIEPVVVLVDKDAAIEIAATALPQQDTDAVWTA